MLHHGVHKLLTLKNLLNPIEYKKLLKLHKKFYFVKFLGIYKYKIIKTYFKKTID